MKNSLIWIALLGASLGVGYATYNYLSAPVIAINEPAEPKLCKVDTVEIDSTGYGVFTDYGAKSYIIITSTGVEVHEEALPDRSNCIE